MGFMSHVRPSGKVTMPILAVSRALKFILIDAHDVASEWQLLAGDRSYCLLRSNTIIGKPIARIGIRTHSNILADRFRHKISGIHAWCLGSLRPKAASDLP